MIKKEISKLKSTPRLQDVLDALKQDITKNINCVQVGEIKSFNATRQTATVELSIKQVVDEKDGVKRFQTISPLLECPCLFLGGGDSYLTIPPKVGDGCIVLFNDRDIDNWFFDGGKKAPASNRRHDFSDGFVIVGFRNLQNAISSFSENAVRLQFDDSNKIELKSGTIESTTPLFKQDGNMQVEGAGVVKQGLQVGGTVTKFGGSGAMVFDTDLEQPSGRTLSAGNGASGTFTSQDGKTITVTDGIVTSIA